ncbi:MAG: methyltransferase domain-containing protein [Phycisphaerales bacterium]
MDTRDEGRRVERKTDRVLTLDQLRWAGLGQGSSVLDLGCAAGTTCRIMAAMVGNAGRVVGVDNSECRLAEGRKHADHRSEIEYRHGDAAQIPAADNEFDLTWSRFLFEYLPSPETALAEMIRVTKPTGTVCVSDIDGNCIWHHPCDPGLRTEIDAALRVIAGGFSPRIGLSLFAMLVDGGLRDVAVDIRPYHVIAGSIDSERAEQWQMKLDGVAATLRARGWLPSRAAALSEAFMAHLHDPRTLTYSVLISVRGTVPIPCSAGTNGQ